MEKNCDITEEMGDHLPIKRPRQDQSCSNSQLSSESPVGAKPLPKDANCDITGDMGDHLPSSKSQLSSESPVAAKPFPKETNWADLFVKEFTSASDLDDARNRADKLLKSFEASIRACLIPIIKEEQAVEGDVSDIFENAMYKGMYVTPTVEFVPGMIEDDDEDEDEDEEAKAKAEERLMRRKWGIDENDQMPEHLRDALKSLGMDPRDFGHVDKQPEDMDDGDEIKK